LSLALVVAILAAASFASISSCPADSPCTGCVAGRNYACITIPTGNHDPTLADEARLVQEGYTGFTANDTLSYRVVFHENAANYSCGTWCTNVNKLFGVTRGMVQVMDQSCIFGWGKGLNSSTEGKILTWAYGWKNESLPPWKTPGQMPEMSVLEVQHEYLFSMAKFNFSCVYSIYDGATLELLSQASTPQQPDVTGPYGYHFTLFFGGTEASLDPVTVSYSPVAVPPPLLLDGLFGISP